MKEIYLKEMDFLYTIVTKIFPISIFVIGQIGNLLGLVVFQRKKLKKIGPRSSFSYLLFYDLFYLFQIIIPTMQYAFHIRISGLSNAACKIYNYWNYSLATPSSMILVYITADRLLSFKKPAFAARLRKKSTQIIYFLAITIWNLVW